MDQSEFNKHCIKQIHWNHLEVGKIYKIVNYVVFEEPNRMRLVLQDEPSSSSTKNEWKRMYSLWVPDKARYIIEGLELTHLRSNGKIDGKWEFDVVQYVPESTIHS